jgi:hypothetical protein
LTTSPFDIQVAHDRCSPERPRLLICSSTRRIGRKISGNNVKRTPLDLDYGERFLDDPCTVDTGLSDPPAYPNVVDMGAYEYRYGTGTCWDTVVCAGRSFGDATCDGSADLADLFALKAHFGKSAPWTPPDCCADFTHDG